MTGPMLQVDGLKDFVRAAKAMDRDLPKAVRMAFNDSIDIVYTSARGDIPQRSGKAYRSVRKASTQTSARIRGGGGKAPYYPWLDFGGRIKRARRPFLKRGRYIYNAYFK